MKLFHIFLRIVVLLVATVLPAVAAAQAPAPPAYQEAPQPPSQPQPQQPLYPREQLAQMLAPIALYPDALLSQILMASTYPLEVVEADRWMHQHQGLKDEALDAALAVREWDPSIKALCHFPTVLAEMDKNLSRTTQLGNAFLAQQAEVMDVIQELRHKAQELGTLDSCPQQRVVVRDKAILIEPVEPAVVYVPYYNPVVVFGPWWYPAFPPFVWFPGFYVSTGIVFSAGFFVGPAVIGWTAWNWPGHFLTVNAVVAAPFIGASAAAAAAGFHNWTHDPVHRLGAAYADPATARRFGQTGAAGAGIQRSARGFTGPGASPQGAVSRQGRAGVSSRAGRAGPQLSPFTGLSRHGGGFESRATQRGGGYPRAIPFGHGGGGYPRAIPFGHGGGGAFPSGHGGGGGGGGGHHR